jgi:hypothetical protein
VTRIAPALLLMTFTPVAAAAPKIADENGTPVHIESSRPQTTVYIAKGPVPRRAEPDPFEILGVAPVDVKLAPGIYTIETEGPTQSTGHETITVDRWPLDVKVKTGDAAVRSIGMVLLAAGTLAIITGIVIVASFGSGEGKFDKYTFSLPFFLGGAASAGIGVGMLFLGATNISAQMPPSQAPRGAGLQASVHF